MEKDLERIIYVDDKEENRETAENYFTGISDYNLETYATIQEGKEAIEEAEEKGKPYLIGLFDLDMTGSEEGEEAGVEMITYAQKKGVFSYIVTQHQSGGEGHGPSTKMKNQVKDVSISGKKTEKKTWEEVHQTIDNFIGNDIHKAMQRYRKHTGKGVNLTKNIGEYKLKEKKGGE